MFLDPFYPIFDSAAWLERLVPQGIKLVQLRIKDKPQDEIQIEIRKAKEICEKHHCQLIVNDYWQLAIKEGCDFIHLGQEDLNEANLDTIREAGLKLGVSTHNHAELERALAIKPDYIAIGPVYPTILKKMIWEPQGLDTVTQWKELVGSMPLVGIGGISLQRANGVFQAGADIVAAVTDITLNENPEMRVKEWLQLTREYIK